MVAAVAAGGPWSVASIVDSARERVAASSVAEPPARL